ncbi:MAG: hypothetical protein UIM53_00945 [Acutalibacteraceae bacterium]|nr:hypothetical protein [Acutalibacteraceae bacterium]
MIKEDLILLFRNYNENKAMLELRQREKRMIAKRLAGEREIETSLTSAYGLNNDIRSKNSTSDKVGNAVAKDQAKLDADRARLKELDKEIEQLQNKVDEIEIRLRGLKYKERIILNAYYAEGRTAEDISCNLYFEKFSRTCSKRYIEKVIQKGTEKILKM